MKRILAGAAVATFALAFAPALASPQIPTPANPYPDQPVATDGSPLPAHNVRNEWSALATESLVTGRSVYVTPRR